MERAVPSIILVAWSRSWVFRSLTLASATTRTPGLIANVDIAPTILHLFAAPIPRTMVGRPVQVTAKTMSTGSGNDGTSVADSNRCLMPPSV